MIAAVVSSVIWAVIRVVGHAGISAWNVRLDGSWQLVNVILNVLKASLRPTSVARSVITTVKRAMVSQKAAKLHWPHFYFEKFPSAPGPLACTSCPNHFMLEGSLCTECLSMQYYDAPTQACKTCHESCRSCSGPGQYSCVTCAFPLHLDRLNNQCVPCCTSDATPEDQSCCHCDKDTGW